MTTGSKIRDGSFGLAGLEPAVSSPEGPLPGDPISLGAIVALIVSDLGAERALPGVQSEAGLRREQSREVVSGRSLWTTKPIESRLVLRRR